jgi:hypothetical protein
LTTVSAAGTATDAARRVKTEATPAFGNFHIGQTINGPMINSWKSQAKYQLSPMHML